MRPKQSGIYQIKCVPTGKIYIGSSVDIYRRWQDHRSSLNSSRRTHHSKYLQRAWIKYGAEQFEFSIVELCAKDDLVVREQHYIDTWQPAFNVSKSAIAPIDQEFTPEIRDNMRKSQEAKNARNRELYGCSFPPEQVANMQAGRAKRRELNMAQYGMKVTPEHYQKMKAYQEEFVARNKDLRDKGLPTISEDHRTKLVEAGEARVQRNMELYGTPFPPGYKERMEEGRLQHIAKVREKHGAGLPPEVVQKITESRMKEFQRRIETQGFIFSEESRQRMSDAQKGKKLPKEQVDKIVATKKAKRLAEEAAGIPHPLVGKKQSKEAKEKRVESIRLLNESLKAAGLPTTYEKMAETNRRKREEAKQAKAQMDLLDLPDIKNPPTKEGS